MTDIQPKTALTRQQVAVLLATYNGASHIEAQLNSFSAQTLTISELYVSDDGSSDATLALADRWAEANPAVTLHHLQGPRQGFSENFRHLIAQADTQAQFVAFADQDDIWLPEKLEISVRELMTAGDVPAMFCGRTVNFPSARQDDLSPLFARPPSFANAIVQSIGGGNTMMLNRKAFELVRESARRTGFVSHDWWCYILVSGAGGKVIYWPEPLVRYRQHGGNLVGSNTGWPARLTRLRLLMHDRFRMWTDRNLEGVAACSDLLVPDAVQLAGDLAAARKRGLLSRLRFLRRSGIYRQTIGGQFGLYLAMALRKL